jgi:hypothetical protein
MMTMKYIRDLFGVVSVMNPDVNMRMNDFDNNHRKKWKIKELRQQVCLI